MTQENNHNEEKPVIQKKFDFENVPKDGVGFEIDKGIFTYSSFTDKFCNHETGAEVEQSFDMALNLALDYGSPQKAIEAIDYGYEKSVDKDCRDFLAKNAKDWTLVFDVFDNNIVILRGKKAEQAIQEKISQHKECWARKKAVSTVDLNAKPKTNAEKLQQCISKAVNSYLNSKIIRDNPEEYTTAEGVKLFLLATPSVKLEQMTKLIDAVAPMAAFNSEKNKFSERVKYKIQQDKKFMEKLAANNKKSVQKKGR